MQLGIRRRHADIDEVNAVVVSLRACANNKDLRRGIKLHDAILRGGVLKNCGDALVTMYAKCGALVKAKELFDVLQSRDVFTWTALISGYSQQGQGHLALHYFELMQGEGLSPDEVTFSSVLKACASTRDTDKGTKIHDEIIKQGLLRNNIVLATALVTMYAKCGALAKAWQVLEELPFRNVTTWNALIVGYAEYGKGEDALNCFQQMQKEGISADTVTLICILKACGSIGATEKGKEIHQAIAKLGFVRSKIGNSLITMYANCGDLTQARQVLEDLPDRDVVSWNALLTGYVEHGEGEQALSSFEQLQREGLSPDAVTFLCILKACGITRATDHGEKVHDMIMRCGLLENNTVLGNALVDMYVKCGVLCKARQVLEQLPTRNVISWTSLITGYSEHGKGEQALQCFVQMQEEGHDPNVVTYACILKACGSIGAADKGEEILTRIADQGLLQTDRVIGNALVDMYAKCGCLAKAQRVLEELPVRNVVGWTALIAGYIEQGEAEQALCSFERMQREGLSPSVVTYACILKACGSIRAADKGEKVHDRIAKEGLLKRNNFLGIALVDMYAKCGIFAKASRVFEELPTQNVIAWNALIAGYVEHSRGAEALECFEQMQGEGVCPDTVTLICMLKALGSLGAAEMGGRIHDEIATHEVLKSGDVVLATALVDMYAKCGAFAKAHHVLEGFSVRNITSWNALISGYARHGKGVQALTCLEQMQHEGASPNGITLASVLSACSHLGLKEEAQTCLVSVATKYDVQPGWEHYACMADLLGRVGHLDEATGLIEKMPSFTTAVQSALLGACWKWGDVGLARDMQWRRPYTHQTRR